MRRSIVRLVLVLTIGLALVGCSSDRAVGPVDFYGPPPPNPLNLKVTHQLQPYPETDITFSTPEAGWVRLEVLNITGYKVKLLLDDEMDAGTMTVTWDGTNEDGEKVDNGLFMFDLQGETSRTWEVVPFCWEGDCE